jgi:very-long-chain (3R)-3-hydroxyacyl-CoA dehydratase
MDDQVTHRQAAASSSKQKYLLSYNVVCLALWSTVTLRAILLIPTLLAHDKLHGLFEALFPLLKWTQTLALLEIVHSLAGLVRASPITTAMQVASRIIVVWGVLTLYPQVVAAKNTWGRPAPGPNGGPYPFAGILMAWGITEIIRYGFFVYKEGISSRTPSWLTWLRYNTFFILYPVGITSECWLMYLALTPAQKEEKGVDWILKAILFIYVPGSYILYTHMMAQRRKVLKGKGKAA